MSYRVSVLSGFWPIVVWLTLLAIMWCLYKSVAVVCTPFRLLCCQNTYGDG